MGSKIDFDLTEKALPQTGPPSYSESICTDPGAKRQREVSSSSPSAPSPKRATIGRIHLKSALRASLGDQIAADIESKIITTCENSMYDANMMRVAADEEFIDGFDEKKLDLRQMMNEILEEVPENLDDMKDEMLRLVSRSGR